MSEPLTKATFEKLCSQWTNVINHNESGIHIWLPVTGAYIRIKQFLTDATLQKKLFGNTIPKMLLVNANELPNFSFEEFEKLVYEELVGNVEKLSLATYLKNNSQKLVIFFVGFDTALKNGHIDTLQQISGLLQTYPYFSVILCSEFDIAHSPILPTLALKLNLLQNIFYESLYSREDANQFFIYLEDKWKCKFEKKKTEALAKEIGGHFWLIKESARILRTNPSLSLEEILTSSTLVRKGLTLFMLFNEKDQKNILNILTGSSLNETSEYLSQTKLVIDNIVQLPYWYKIKSQILSLGGFEQKQNFTKSLDVYFTAMERDIFEHLLDKKRIVTREEIAYVLWQEKKEEKYSDWAIDQLIHRLREKITFTNAPYALITKKGEGFILTEK